MFRIYNYYEILDIVNMVLYKIWWIIEKKIIKTDFQNSIRIADCISD